MIINCVIVLAHACYDIEDCGVEMTQALRLMLSTLVHGLRNPATVHTWTCNNPFKFPDPLMHAVEKGMGQSPQCVDRKDFSTAVKSKSFILRSRMSLDNRARSNFWGRPKKPHSFEGDRESVKDSSA